MTGFVHILKQSGKDPGTFSYTVIFAPVGPSGTGGSVPTKNLHGKDDLADFLKQIIPEHSIRDAFSELDTNGNTSIAFVKLPEEKLRNLGLIA